MHSTTFKPATAFQNCLIALALLLVGVRGAQAQSGQDKFFLLIFRMKAGVVTLVKSQVVPGILKQQRDSAQPAALRFTLEKAADESLWSKRIDDPSIQRLEYEDPDHPGELRSKTVQLDEIEFIVRVPYQKEARQIAVYREELRPTAPGAQASPPVKQLLTRVSLPSEESK